MQNTHIDEHVQSMSSVAGALCDTEGITCSLIKRSVVSMQWHTPHDGHCAADSQPKGISDSARYMPFPNAVI